MKFKVVKRERQSSHYWRYHIVKKQQLIRHLMTSCMKRAHQRLNWSNVWTERCACWAIHSFSYAIFIQSVDVDDVPGLRQSAYA